MELELVSEPIIKATEKAQAKLTAGQIYEWGGDACPHFTIPNAISSMKGGTIRLRRECNKCWNELLEAST